MTLRLLILCSTLCLLPCLAHADFYKYYDNVIDLSDAFVSWVKPL